MMAAVTLADIQAAQDRIAHVALRTPVIPVPGLDIPHRNGLWLKAENLQTTGSFKIRGAYNTVASLSSEERDSGVITYSSGNHGQAVACAAHLMGVDAVIVMPEDAVPVKVAATQRWGATVTFAGHTSLDRQERALELVREHGYTVIPPFDDARIIAGQGTAGVELMEQLPDVDAVVVQIGGGGLISGVATAVKALRPQTAVIGVEPEGAADARDSLASGQLTTWGEVNTVADGLRTNRVGQLNFEAISTLVDEIVTVTDDEILAATAWLAREARLIAEPSGAVAVAAVLQGRVRIERTRVAAIVSGGNVSPQQLVDCLMRDVRIPTRSA